MHPVHRLTTWVFLSCVLVAGKDVMAQPAAIDLGTLGGRTSVAVAVNERGQVVGQSSITADPRSAQHAFSWTAGGGMVDLGTLGGTHSYATAVNDKGQVVGYSFTSSGYVHAFLWTADGGMVELGTLGGTSSGAVAVNDNGQVVGSSSTSSEFSHAFLWTADGGMVDLGTLGGISSTATDLNDNGQVVGYIITSSFAMHAFSWTAGGDMIDLGTLGGTWSEAVAVNDNGQVVGRSSIASGDTHGFLWTAAEGMIDLGTLPGPFLIDALAVNDRGQVVGDSWDYDDNPYHAFSWTGAGDIVDLGTLGGTDSYARDVNNNGQVVGFSASYDVGHYHAFSWTADGGMIDLGRGGAHAVNDVGQVVGYSDTTGTARATMWVTVPTAPVTIATLTAGSPPSPGGWYRNAVTVALTATDDTGPSGVAHIAYRIGQGPEVVAEGDRVSFTIAAEGEVDVAFYAVDQQGNVEEVQTLTVRIDRTPPTITIAAPPVGLSFLEDEVVAATYVCVDALSGVASCAGPMPSGSAYDTTELGNFNFVVTSSDLAGNTSSAAQNYSVVSPAEAVEQWLAVIAQLDLKRGIAKSLTRKLQNVMAALTAGNAGQRQDARHTLEAARHEIEAQRGKALTDDQANALVAVMARVAAAL